MVLFCLYQFRAFGLLACGNKNLVLAKTGREVYLLGDFSMGEGVFFPGGENEQIFARLPPQCRKAYQPHPSFFIPLLDSPLIVKLSPRPII